MSAIHIGPLALPTAPLPWFAALLVAWLLTSRWAPRLPGAVSGLPDEERARWQRAAEDVVWVSAAIGFAVSRAVFVAMHWDAYEDFVWSIADLRDGGWSPWPGMLAALVWASMQAARAPQLRPTLGAGAAAAIVAGLAVWSAVGPPQGMRVPSVQLMSLKGDTADLPRLVHGQPAVINLWASWCAPCRVEMPALAAEARRQPGVRFLFVNQGERSEVIQRYLHAQDFQLTEVWLDPSARLGPASGSRGCPPPCSSTPRDRSSISTWACSTRRRSGRGWRA